jgi:hypothetical protein
MREWPARRVEGAFPRMKGETMRRTLLVVVLTALVTSAITSVTVSAASSDAPRSDDGDQELGPRLPVIVDTQADCGVPPRGQDWPNQDALEDSIRCLEDEVINVNRFMKAFFRCTRIVEVTRYGSVNGTSGYEFVDAGTDVARLRTALDFTADPTTEPFRYFMLWQDSNFCLS